MNRPEFAALMAGMASSANKKYTEEEAVFWYGALADVPDEFLRQAFFRFAATGGDWPSITKIRALADEQQHGMHVTAGEAFELVTQAVRRFGSYDAINGLATLDGTTKKALKACGGWMWACDLSSGNREMFSSRFAKVYDAIVQREQKLRRTPEAIRPAITAGSTAVTDQAKLLAGSMGLPKPKVGR